MGQHGLFFEAMEEHAGVPDYGPEYSDWIQGRIKGNLPKGARDLESLSELEKTLTALDNVEVSKRTNLQKYHRSLPDLLDIMYRVQKVLGKMR